MRVAVVEFPFGGSEDVFYWVHQHVHFLAVRVLEDLDVVGHILLVEPCCEYGTFCVQQALDGVLHPGVLGLRGGQARVEHEEHVLVWVVWEEVLGGVQGVEVVCVVEELHGFVDTFSDRDGGSGAVGGGLSVRGGRSDVFVALSVVQGLWSDEVDFEVLLWEQELQLFPDVAGQLGLGTGSEYEDTHGLVLCGCSDCSVLERVQGVAECGQGLQALQGDGPLRVQRVRGELVEHRPDGDRVAQHLGHCGELELCVHGVEGPGVQEQVPIGQVDGPVGALVSWEVELWERSAASQVVLIDVDFLQDLVLLRCVVLLVLLPGLAGVVCRDTRDGACVLDGFVCHGALGQRLYPCGALSQVYRWGLVPRVESVLFSGLVWRRRRVQP